MPTTELQPVIPQPMEQDSGPALSEYLGIFRRRIKLILIPFILCFVLSGVVAYVVPPEFEQTTVFKINDPGVSKNILAGLQATITHKPLLRTMSSDIKTRRFLRPIVEKVRLNEGFNLSDALEETDFYKYIFKNLQIQVPNDTQRDRAGPDIVRITYKGRNQAKNVEFLNEIRESYKEYFRRQYRETIRGIYDQQRARVRDLRNEVARLEAAYEAFRNGDDYHLVGIKRAHLKEIADLKSRENDLRLEIKGLEAQLVQVKVQLRDQKKTSHIQNRVTNPQKLALKGLIDAERKVLNQMIDVQGWSDLVPAVQEQREKITRMEEQYAALADDVVGGATVQINPVYVQLQNDRNNLQRQIDGARDMLSQVLRRIEKLQGELTRENDLTRTDTNFQNEIRKLKTNEANVAGRFDRIKSEWQRIQGEGSDLFETMELPNPNTKPVFPSVPLFLAIGAGFGLLLGLGLAFLKEFSSLTYLTPSQVQSRLTVPILGEVAEIKTEEELAAERARRRRNWIAGSILLGLVAFVHYCYFDPDMIQILPPVLVDILNTLYKGG